MTDETLRAEQAASFDQAADVYERARPEYPEDAVDWLIPSGAKTVLDLGAGTGKLTRALAARGLDVIAVDPSQKMLAQLSSSLPGAVVHEGTAEDIPLVDASVDAVFVAQAWHWVDQDAALPSIARVLKPGGTLGLIWNIRDESTPWVKRLSEIVHSSNAEIFVEEGKIQRGPFAEIETSEFAWAQEFDRTRLIELVRSRSYFITAPEAERRRILDGVDKLLTTDPELAEADHWTMPYVTLAFRMRLPDE